MIQFKYISRENSILEFPRFRFHLFPERGYLSASLLLVGAGGAVYVFSVFLFQTTL